MSYVWKLRFNDVCFWFATVTYFLLLNNYVASGLWKHIFLIKLDIRHFFVRSPCVWKLRYNYVAFWFFNYCIFFYVRIKLSMLFLQWHIFHDDVTLRYACITYGNDFITRLHFFRHYDVFFIVSQLHYLFVQCSYVFMTLELRYVLVRSNYVRELRYKIVIF